MCCSFLAVALSLNISTVHRCKMVLSMISFVSRRFCTCCVYRNTQSGKQFGMLQKMLKDRSKKSRNQIINDYVPQLPKCSPPVGVSNYMAQESRRQHVLNAVLMTNISDLMSTGEMSKELAGFGIELHRVQVTKDFTIVNVFWSGSESSNNVTVQNILDANANKLRTALIGLHIMGNVPQVRFIRDKRQTQVNDVLRLLAKADLGPEATRDPLLQHLSQPPIHIPVIEKTIENVDVHFAEEKEVPVPEQLPTMTCDVYGLDHASLMTKVTEKVNKSKAKHRQDPSEDAPEPMNLQSGSVTTPASRQDAVMTFLRNRKKQQQSKTKRERDPDFNPMSTYEMDEEEVDIEDFYDEHER